MAPRQFLVVAGESSDGKSLPSDSLAVNTPSEGTSETGAAPWDHQASSVLGRCSVF